MFSAQSAKADMGSVTKKIAWIAFLNILVMLSLFTMLKIN
jgi:hypothetical protein